MPTTKSNDVKPENTAVETEDKSTTSRSKSNRRSTPSSSSDTPVTSRTGNRRGSSTRSRSQREKPARELMIINFKPGETEEIRRQSPTAIQITEEDFPEIRDCYGITGNDGMIPTISLGEGTQLFDRRLYLYLENSADVEDSTGNSIFELFISCLEIVSESSDLSEVRSSILNRAIRNCFRIEMLEQWLKEEQLGEARTQVLAELNKRLSDLKNPKDSQTAGTYNLKRGVY